MSQRIDMSLPMDGQPTREGRGRRPRGRTEEFRRPTQIYRMGIRRSLTTMLVMARARDEGFRN